MTIAKRKKKQRTSRGALVLIGIAALMGLVLREQLRLPPDERTWHGTLFNIPYDFRWPTIERLRARSACLWHGLDDQLLPVNQPTTC